MAAKGIEDKEVPTRPVLALNVAVAGARNIPASVAGQLDVEINQVLAAFDEILLSLVKEAKAAYPLCDYYREKTTPKLRVVSGLADGCDMRVARLARARTIEDTGVTHELGAVLPFAREVYRDQSPIADKSTFDDLLSTCLWVHELDGRHVPDPTAPDASAAEKALAKQCRARAYRAQSEILLRQCDVLVGISDPDETGKPGGTRETLTAAMVLGIPVVHISLKDLAVSFLETRAQWADLAFATPVSDWRSRLKVAVGEIVAAPFHIESDDRSAERAVLEEFFPSRPAETGLWTEFLEARDRLLRGYWERRESRLADQCRKLHSEDAKVPPQTPAANAEKKALTEIEVYRERAAKLSMRYASLYRGAFSLNFRLAVVAVTLASLSLLVYLWPIPRALGGPGMTRLVAVSALSGPAELNVTQHRSSEAVHAAHGALSAERQTLLVMLALAEFATLAVILWTTRAAHKHRWNEKAVVFRYIAERLRPMRFLSAAGTLRPPPASVTRAKPRRVQMTIGDWLAMAAIRAHEASSQRVALGDALRAMNNDWLQTQVDYHKRNACRMALLTSDLDRRARGLSIIVLVVVTIDLVLLVMKSSGVLGGSAKTLVEDFSSLLIFAAIVLPAAVAGANGIRFQSECDRLSERSNLFARMLGDMQREAGDLERDISEVPADANPGAWSGSVAVFAERCAQLFIDEVAEWSVLYAKELGEV